MTDTIRSSPIGWWLCYNERHWSGPYESADAAMKAAEVLVAKTRKTFELLQTAPWDRRTIEIETMTETKRSRI